MTQVPGIRPFHECDLADQLRFDPTALVHFLCSQRFAPPPDPLLSRMRRPASCSSGIEKRHTRLCIAFALSYARREKRILIRGQRDVKSTEIVFEITEALGAGDRDDVLALSQHPGQRKLCRRAILPLRKVFHMGCKLKITIKASPWKRGIVRRKSSAVLCSENSCGNFLPK
jgi:hypothetical protein